MKLVQNQQQLFAHVPPPPPQVLRPAVSWDPLPPHTCMPSRELKTRLPPPLYLAVGQSSAVYGRFLLEAAESGIADWSEIRALDPINEYMTFIMEQQKI